METIGRKWPADAPGGDFQMDCSFCGVRWRRSQMRKDRSGSWVCPDEGDGRDMTTLAEGNAAAAAARREPRAREGGPFSRAGFPDPTTGDPTEAAEQRLTREDI